MTSPNNLYYLTDENSWYHNLVYVCGEPWTTKKHLRGEAVIYTYTQMLEAKEFYRRKKIRVFESQIVTLRKKKNRNDKPKFS